MIAVLEAYRAGMLNKAKWPANIIAGVIVGVVSLPLSIAFAIASGVEPEAGLITAIVAGLIVTLIGGSRVQIAGPTGAFVVILLGILNQHGFHGLQIATMMAGAMLILMGVFRMGPLFASFPHRLSPGSPRVLVWLFR